jgi:hypothetical protein
VLLSRSNFQSNNFTNLMETILFKEDAGEKMPTVLCDNKECQFYRLHSQLPSPSEFQRVAQKRCRARCSKTAITLTLRLNVNNPSETKSYALLVCHAYQPGKEPTRGARGE